MTYVIRQGDNEIFIVDPKTGAIKTRRGLDYERETQHVLVIGTVENTSNLPGASTRVVINVIDVNDIPPVFTMVPRPVRLDDNVPIGATVVNLIATDSDGTAPGNQVRYDVIGRGIAGKYFVIDPDSGVLRVRDDLRKVPDITEFQVDVRAHDLGDPQLSSVTTVPVFVRHVTGPPAESGLGFAEDSYNVDVPEDAGSGTLIKILSVINSNNPRDAGVTHSCEIYNGNEDGLFKANVTEERNCALWLEKGNLDFETTESYQIKIRLYTGNGAFKSGRNVTMVKIQVVDVNDNKPEFMFPQADLTKDRYFAKVPRAAQFDSTVLDVKAHDKDNGRFGKLEFRLAFDNENSRAGDFFAIDPISGIIRTTANFDNVEPRELPFK